MYSMIFYSEKHTLFVFLMYILVKIQLYLFPKATFLSFSLVVSYLHI